MQHRFVKPVQNRRGRARETGSALVRALVYFVWGCVRVKNSNLVAEWSADVREALLLVGMYKGGMGTFPLAIVRELLPRGVALRFSRSLPNRPKGNAL